MFCQIALPDAHIISADLPHGNFGGGYRIVQKPLFRRFAQAQQKLALVRANSHRSETLSTVVSVLRGHLLDLLFIDDGDHSYDGVRRDFEMYSPLVRKGGIVAFHDIVEHVTRPECQVAAFWKEIKDCYRCKEIVYDRTQGWTGIGVLYV